MQRISLQYDTICGEITMIWSDSQEDLSYPQPCRNYVLYNIHADNHCSRYNVLFVHTIHIIFIHNDDSTHSFFLYKGQMCCIRYNLNKNVHRRVFIIKRDLVTMLIFIEF